MGPNAKPMKIEAGTLYYREAESEIWLKPWGRLTRDNTVIEGEDATIKLQENESGPQGDLHSIDAIKAHGSDTYPNRKIQYSAGQLHVDFDEDGQAQKVTGETTAERNWSQPRNRPRRPLPRAMSISISIPRRMKAC